MRTTRFTSRSCTATQHADTNRKGIISYNRSTDLHKKTSARLSLYFVSDCFVRLFFDFTLYERRFLRGCCLRRVALLTKSGDDYKPPTKQRSTSQVTFCTHSQKLRAHYRRSVITLSEVVLANGTTVMGQRSQLRCNSFLTQPWSQVDWICQSCPGVRNIMTSPTAVYSGIQHRTER